MNNQCSINHSCLFSSYCQNPGLQTTYPQKIETFRKGQIIYEEAKDQSAYIIISGIGMMNMGVMYNDTHVEEQLNLALLGKEYAFGSIVPSKSSFFVSYHVQTLTNMKACKLPYAGLKVYLSSDPSVLEKIFLANDLISNAFMRQQWIMNTNKVYDRVQRALIVLNTVRGKSWNRVPLNITHEDLAEIVKADRPSVTLGLKKLQSQGLIELGYGKVWLNNELDFFSNFDESKPNTLSYLPLVQ